MGRVDEELGFEFILLGLPAHSGVHRKDGTEVRGQILLGRFVGSECSFNVTHTVVGDTRWCNNDVHQPNGSRNGTSKRNLRCSKNSEPTMVDYECLLMPFIYFCRYTSHLWNST